MYKGFDSLAALAQDVLLQAPFGSHVLVFYGRRGGFIKLL
jgi:hypothetical protein